MPSMGNITVKDAANADVVYNASVPSAGDRSPARWTQNGASPVIGFRPVFQVMTRDNGNGTGRHMSAVFRFPITDTVNGQLQQIGAVPFTLEGTLPTRVPAADVADAFVQLGNLLASSLVRDVATEGYAPT